MEHRALRELILAAEDLCAANCTRHRNRARLRVLRAVESVEGAPAADPPDRDALLADLASFARDAAEEDPVAYALLQRCFNHGVLSR